MGTKDAPEQGMAQFFITQPEALTLDSGPMMETRLRT